MTEKEHRIFGESYLWSRNKVAYQGPLLDVADEMLDDPTLSRGKLSGAKVALVPGGMA